MIDQFGIASYLRGGLERFVSLVQGGFFLLVFFNVCLEGSLGVLIGVSSELSR